MVENTKNKKFVVLNYEELLSQTSKLPKRKTIWGGVKEGSFGIIYGPSKSGKSTFCENLALSLVVGRKNFWMRKLFDGKPHKVLFLSLEEDCLGRSERISNQIKNLTVEERELVKKNYFQPDCHFQQNIQNDNEWKLLYQTIKETKAKIIFIDSLTRLYSGSLEESSVAKQVTLRLRKMTRELGVTLLTIHHTTKGNGKQLSQDSIAGSRVIAQEADFAIGLNKILNGTRYLKEVFYRYGAHSDTDVIRYDIDENQWLVPQETVKEYTLFQKPDGRADTNIFQELEEFIKGNIDEDNMITSNVLIKKFVDTKIISKPTLYNYIALLCKNKVLKKKSKGVYVLLKESKEVSNG